MSHDPMVDAAARRLPVILRREGWPAITVTLIYWHEDGARCKVQLPSGKYVTVRKEHVTVPEVAA